MVKIQQRSIKSQTWKIAYSWEQIATVWVSAVSKKTHNGWNTIKKEKMIKLIDSQTAIQQFRPTWQIVTDKTQS